MQLLIMPYSLSSCHFHPVQCKYSTQHSVLKQTECEVLTVTQDLHPHKTRGK